MLHVFAKAVLLGFSVAAPVGAIGILCIRRTLSDGRRIGLSCGLGAATADAAYGLLAGVGATAIAGTLSAHQTSIRLVGAVYLAVFAVRTFRAKPPAEGATVARRGGALGAWLSTFGLTITNPTTIAFFAAMFSSFGLGAEHGLWTTALVLSGGVFLGSAAWWLLLSGGVSLLRRRVSRAHLVWINRASGVLLFGFAAASAYAAYR